MSKKAVKKKRTFAKKGKPLARPSSNKIFRGSSKFRSVQKLLSSYKKDNSIKFSVPFNKIASSIYLDSKSFPLSAIEDSLDILLEDAIAKFSGPVEVLDAPEGITRFPNNFSFWELEDKVSVFEMNGIEISFELYDKIASFNETGTSSEITALFISSGCKNHCRTYYNSSPVAKFRVYLTDNKTFVKYRIEPDDVPVSLAQIISAKDLKDIEEGKVVAPTKPSPIEPKTAKKRKVKAAKPKKAKKKTVAPKKKAPKRTGIEAEIRLQIETRKTLERKIEAIRELKELGLSMNEIKKFLKI